MKKSVLVVLVLCGLVALGVFAGTVFLKSDSSSSNSSGSQTSTNSETAGSTAKSTNAAYTKAQVAEHSSRGDCWLIIENGIYDVTTYLNQHPGGISQVLPYCGKDATEAYATQGGRGSHSSNADDIKKQFSVGTLTN